MTEAAIAEWGAPDLFHAVFRFPRAAALRLWPALILRRGGEIHGPSFADQAAALAMTSMRAHLESNFKVLYWRPSKKKQATRKGGRRG